MTDTRKITTRRRPSKLEWSFHALAPYAKNWSYGKVPKNYDTRAGIPVDYYYIYQSAIDYDSVGNLT